MNIEDISTEDLLAEIAKRIDYGCSECNGVAEPTIAAVRAELKKKQYE